MDLLMSMVSALAAVAVPAAAAAAGEFKAGEHNSSQAVADLRRQLMNDNYDYVAETSSAVGPRLHAESEEGEPLAATLRAAVAAPTLETPVDFYTKVASRGVARTAPDVRDLRRNPMYDQRSKYVAPSEHRALATAGDDKALYADDPAAADAETPREPGEYTTVKYSLLEVRAGGRDGRRALRPHLVKEERPGEVSIVNLGEGAVPQFRLPRPRAQYMRDSDREAPRTRRARAPRRRPLPAVDLD